MREYNKWVELAGDDDAKFLLSPSCPIEKFVSDVNLSASVGTEYLCSAGFNGLDLPCTTLWVVYCEQHRPTCIVLSSFN
jgi:hypothetical protein